MISIVIPVYNEQAVIEKTLKSLPFDSGIEVIVVDGNSTDKTMDVVKRFPVKAVLSLRGRASQMNAGASVAKGDVLLFVHADCVIDPKGLSMIDQHMVFNCVGGCFTHRIDSARWIYRLIEFSGNVRAEIFKIFYGDQAIFVRKDVFDQIGGFKAVAIFEDAILSKKLRTMGKTVVIDAPAVVSPRRWEKSGVGKTTMINWLLTIGFMIGIAPHQLSKFYKNIR